MILIYILRRFLKIDKLFVTGTEIIEMFLVRRAAGVENTARRAAKDVPRPDTFK